ncbi:MAG: putative exported protein [Cenarchaeum symbiont of Oopsacas minuta]|nr:putative exported protein [Cenarchaeum symbiont of Oopsacas minuta]
MIVQILALVILVSSLLGSQVVMAQIPTGQSPFERTYTGIKLLDAYFGTAEEKMEIEPGDFHVPFTIVFSNVGNSDIVGLTGDLAMPINFRSFGLDASMVRADTEASVRAGDSFTLTFYIDVGEHTKIGKYTGTVITEYSRLRETGQRSELFTFDFELVGRSIIDASVINPFVSSFGYNNITINLKNTGSASASGVIANIRTLSMDDNIESVESQGIVIFESIWNIGNIKAGKAKNITTNIYVPGDLASKTIKFPLNIKYFDAQGLVQNVERTVDIYVQGLVDLHIYGINVIDISNKQTIIGHILNEGNEKALFAFVTVESLKGSNIKNATQFIDDIDIDSPVPFNIPIEFDGMPQYGYHDIKVDVRYKDGIRNETTITYNATVFIPEPIDNDGVDVTAIVLVLLTIFVVVIVFIFMIKNKRKVRND